MWKQGTLGVMYAAVIRKINKIGVDQPAQMPQGIGELLEEFSDIAPIDYQKNYHQYAMSSMPLIWYVEPNSLISHLTG